MNRLLNSGRIPTVATFAFVLILDSATAQDFSIQRDFQFIQSRSTLVVDGGFAGSAYKQTYHASGTFGLESGYESGVSCASVGCPPPPTHIPFARFDDVDAWLQPNGLLAYVLPLDHTLNLTGLDGTFNPATPNRFSFIGNDGQGQPFHLDATIRGPLIHLVGENTPGCCDFQHYKFDAFAYVRPYPDFNLDGLVNTADYVTWRNSAKALNPDGTDATATNSANYELWRAHFGEVNDFSAFAGESAGLNTSTVPEPTTILLAIPAMAIACHRRRLSTRL
jgi:hypothetical protein